MNRNARDDASPAGRKTTGRRPVAPWAAAAVCAVAGAVVFQHWGNANHGYIDTRSLVWWWGFQWSNAQSETQHGWLILALSAWLLGRNLGIFDFGFSIFDRGKGDRLHAREKVRAAGLEASPRADPRRRIAQGSKASDAHSVGRSAAIQNPKSKIENSEREPTPQSAVRNPPSIAPAVAAMLAGLALHALGFAAQQARLSIIALLVFTWGVLRLGGGRRWDRAAAFPLAFLVFAIPVDALDSLGFWLRLWVIRASTAIAHGVGIGVIRSGTQLVAPDGRYQYDVAAACSGMRSLMALAALSLLIGYLNVRAWWRRGLLLALCFPLMYVGNVARIVAIILAAQAGGPRWGDRAHEVMGFGVFVIVLGGVLAAASLLRRTEPEYCHPIGDNSLWGDAAVPEPGGRGGSAVWLAVAVVVLAAVATAAGLRHLERLPDLGVAGIALTSDGRAPAELPTILGREWVGWPAAVTAVERQILPPDTGYSRMRYVASSTRQQVFMSIVLSGRDRSSIHRPELCLVGQGWTIDGAQRHAFADGRGGRFPATLLAVTHPDAAGRPVPQLVAYWFVASDAVVATHWQRLLHDAWNRVVHARADRWAYVLLQTDASDGERAALARMQSVLDRTLPSVMAQPAAR